eukprot:361445-Chlamydomonas_euryale.AAC.7
MARQQFKRPLDGRPPCAPPHPPKPRSSCAAPGSEAERCDGGGAGEAGRALGPRNIYRANRHRAEIIRAATLPHTHALEGRAKARRAWRGAHATPVGGHSRRRRCGEASAEDDRCSVADPGRGDGARTQLAAGSVTAADA